MDIKITLSGDRAVLAQLEGMPARLHARLVSRITALTANLLGAVRAAEPHRTGKLQSETVSYIDETENSVRGRVKISAPGVKYEYGKAAALEYGAHGVGKNGHGGHSAGAAFTASRDRIDDAFSRPGDIMAHRYLRGPLDEMRSEIEASLAEAAQDLG